MSEFRLPSLGADMDEATILEWKVGPGDRLVPGEVILVIDTEKSEMDVEALHPGTVTEVVVPEGEVVPVGAVLLRYEPSGQEGAPPPTPAKQVAAATGGDSRESLEPAPPAVAATTLPVPPGPAPKRPAPARFLVPAVAGPGASPLARRLAAERGPALADLRGTGPGGAVIARDVRQAPAPARRAAPAVGTAPRDRGQGLRHAIAELMARSKREIPHYYLDEELDVGPALARLRALNERRGVVDRVVPAALLLRATAMVAAASPDLNGHLLDGRFTPAGTVNLGTAISLRSGGLVAPAILGADRLPLDELMRALRDLVARARAGRLRPAELSEATITVTNLGDQGVHTVHPVIVPPQVAMVGFGRIDDRPVVVDGEVRVSTLVTASLAADHRVSDGMVGARFLTRLARQLADLDTLFADTPPDPEHRATSGGSTP